MTKLDKLKQAEHLYIYEKQPLDIIGAKLNLSRRTFEKAIREESKIIKVTFA